MIAHLLEAYYGTATVVVATVAAIVRVDRHQHGRFHPRVRFGYQPEHARGGMS